MTFQHEPVTTSVDTYTPHQWQDRFLGGPCCANGSGNETVILFPALRHIAVSISAISFDSLCHKNPCNYRARWNL